jgi:hypothetical protein
MSGFIPAKLVCDSRTRPNKRRLVSSSHLFVLLRRQLPFAMQQFREPRSSYPYDDQAAAYASVHTSEYSLTTPAYPQYDSSNFYGSSAIPGMSDGKLQRSIEFPTLS